MYKQDSGAFLEVANDYLMDLFVVDNFPPKPVV